MVILVALLFELLLGWPSWLYSSIRHPVVWIGALITTLEKRFNRESDTPRRRYLAGLLTSVALILICIGSAMLLIHVLPGGLPGFLLQALAGSSLLAGRSLYEHVAAVAVPLRQSDIPAARKAVSMIVGRKTDDLDEAGISAAALESLAENASDGLIAPLFWGFMLGLPGLAAYKAINTLDSMIGHRSSRYEDYGRFAARLDDVANWAPARIMALLFWSADRCRGSFGRVARQAVHHRSPNAGWPESAMAFALNVRLSGPRMYQGGISEEPWLNAEGVLPGVKELERGLGLYVVAVLLATLLLLVMSLPLVLLA